MDIDVALKSLGEVDIRELHDAIAQLNREAWLAQQIRQNEYEVHQQTESIVLLFTDGKGWPAITIRKEHGWSLLSEQVMPIVEYIFTRNYEPGGLLIRVMIASLPPGHVIKPHVDLHPSFRAGHRIHVPITTDSRVRFMIDGQPYRLEPGQAYEINNQKHHSVMNKGTEAR